MINRHLGEVLSKARTIAIIGAKDTEGHPVNRVGRYLIDAGYSVFPVHPVRKNIWGLPTYTSLVDITEPIDIVNVFRTGDQCIQHAKECLLLARFPLVFWMQQGIWNKEARFLLEPRGVTVIEDACLMIELPLLLKSI